MESLKFGPQWLRNTISNSPPKEGELFNGTVLSNYRYSTEEMLSMVHEESSKKTPEILPFYKHMYIENWQIPLALLLDDDKQPTNVNSKTFFNATKQDKNNVNWRKGNKDELMENWRYPSNKENKDGNYSFLNIYKNANQRKNWRGKPVEEDNRSTNTSKVESDEKSEIAKKTLDHQKMSEAAKNNNISKKNDANWDIDKSFFMALDDCSNIKNVSNQEVKQNDEFELNLKKLENDLLFNLSDLAIDDEKETAERKQEIERRQNSIITWFYIDPVGMVQGPFTEEEMSTWYNIGYFCDTLMIRRSIDNAFITLQQLIHAFGNVQPFLLASAGFPIPKRDQIEENMKPHMQLTIPNQQPISNNIQWNNMMIYNNNNTKKINESNQFQQNNLHHQQHQLYQHYFPNHLIQQNANSQQLDPRILTMNSGNAYMQAYTGNINVQLRPPPQLTPPIINQLINTQKSIPMVNNYSQSASIIHQMPAIVPVNPVKKLLEELHKQNELEMEQKRQSSYFLQQNYQMCNNNSNNTNMIMHTILQEKPPNIQQQQHTHLKMAENVQQQQNYMKSDDNICVSTINNWPSQRQEVKKDLPMMNFDSNDEGEFQIVEHVKRKKFQKDGNETSEKVKPESHQQMMKPLVSNHKCNINTNEVLKSDNRKMIEERSNLPALPAPWINKTKKDRVSAGENLKRIQLEEEEIRNIEMQMKHEIELKRIKNEQESKQKVNRFSWNTILNENKQKQEEKKGISENSENSIWDARPNKILDSEKNSNKKPSRQRNKQPKKSNKHVPSELVNTEKENEFKDWCNEMLGKMNATIDIPVFVNFLADLDSPYEVEDYVKMYLGDSIESASFARKFLERRSSYRKAAKIVEIDDDLCAPPRAINPGSSEDGHKIYKKNKNSNKKTKKPMKVADVNILGFKATAASNRIVGELHEDAY